MNIKNLYQQLLEAYSNKNLNLITAKLILLYKNKNYSKIIEIANRISKHIKIEEEKAAKCFSKLIMLYHPDKGEVTRKTIQQLYEQNDIENLEKHSHILLISDIDTITVTDLDDDIDYNPEYVWDIDTKNGFTYPYSEDDECLEDSHENEFNTIDFEKSFYNLIKIREYGNVDIEFPSYYLEDFEEFELAYCGMESLSGVEHCIHIKILDVSNNALSDLENLWNLKSLEELYIGNNQIGYIDALSNLVNLKVADLSGNLIDDISPLLNLEQLEYVNLIGNPIPDEQIEKLLNKGILVMSEKVQS